MKKIICILSICFVFCISNFCEALNLNSIDVQINQLIETQKNAHEMAEYARLLESKEAVQIAQNYWMEAQNQLNILYTEKEKMNSATNYFSESDVIMIAKVMWGEARGIASDTEVACIGWTILNRVDAGYASTIKEVITAPGQFYYSNSFLLETRFYNLAKDVLTRWGLEKLGYTNVGRVLPNNYLWYYGDGQHNWFRNKYQGGSRWNYSLPSPYKN